MLATFLASHDLAPGTSREEARSLLERLAAAGNAEGVRTVETFVSVERAQAVTLFQAATEEQVRRACFRAGLANVDVFRGERVFTELLDEPRHAR